MLVAKSCNALQNSYWRGQQNTVVLNMTQIKKGRYRKYLGERIDNVVKPAEVGVYYLNVGDKILRCG